MAKTSRDAIRHIRQWSNFFSDLGSFSNSEVDHFLAERQERQYLKQSLKRLVEKGFVKKKDGKFFLTAAGRLFFRKKGVLNTEKIVQENWDGRWRLVSFDVPGGYRRERDELREILKMYDFYPLHKSVWVCPNILSERFWELVVEKKLHGFCKTMVVDILEGDSEIKKHFKITTQ